MTGLTAWAAGSLGGGFTPAFGATDLNSLAALSSSLSTIPFDNTGYALGQFMDASFLGAFAAAQTVVTGAGVSFLFAALQSDGATYGDGRLSGQAVYLPLIDPAGGFPIVAGSTTNIAGDFGYVPLRPIAFKLICSNYSGFALASAGNMLSVKFYRQNMNA